MSAARLAQQLSNHSGVSVVRYPGSPPGQTHLSPGLLRLSVGCEHADDRWVDLEQALGRTSTGHA